MPGPALKSKLIALIREELKEIGPAVGFFPLAEADGTYLIRADGAVAGIGTYQKLQGTQGQLEDLDIGELGPLLGDLKSCADYAADQSMPQECALTYSQSEWAQGRGDYALGAFTRWMPENAAADQEVQIQLNKEVGVFRPERGRRQESVLFAEGDTFTAVARGDYFSVKPNDEAESFGFLVPKEWANEVAPSPRKKSSPGF